MIRVNVKESPPCLHVPCHLRTSARARVQTAECHRAVQQSQFYIILEILEILKASKNIRKAIKYTAAEKQLS